MPDSAPNAAGKSEEPVRAEEPLAGSPAESVPPQVNGNYVTKPPDLDAAIERAFQAANRLLPAEMSIDQAAEFLDVSRDRIILYIKTGKLPCRKVGKRRRIPTAALQEYLDQMLAKARKAADEMTAMWQELGMYDAELPPPKMR
jgi:excisionase family DNA binding protein